MAQKPVIPKSRKTVERAEKQAAKGSVKEVKKAVGARGSTLGNIDSLVNKHLASFRNAEKTLAEAKALVQTYREKYPQLADYIPEGAVERGIHIRENATNESEGLHKLWLSPTGCYEPSNLPKRSQSAHDDARLPEPLVAIVRRSGA